MSMVLDKYVLSQGFVEQVNNLIIGADKQSFDFPMVDMFIKMTIA